ncbi:MAG: hypothetical protein LBR86_01300 [Tannerella sp.]|nr:hypothetical protein [Tannerella sp.]
MKVTTFTLKVTALDLKVTTFTLKVTTLDLKVTVFSLKVTVFTSKVTAFSLKVTTFTFKVTVSSLKITVTGFISNCRETGRRLANPYSPKAPLVARKVPFPPSPYLFYFPVNEIIRE